jgi:hypothetical protein
MIKTVIRKTMEEEMDRACNTYGNMGNAYAISVENPEAKIES